ncbi:MAG: hypothetical protein ABFC18_03395 [Rikenellaceae bacterium]
MSIYAEKSEGEYKTVNPGMYVARCISMIEIGTIKEKFQDQEKTLQKVMIRWELPTEKTVFDPVKGEEPFSVSKKYTLSMHEKSTLRKDLESWRGRGFTEAEAQKFDITKLLGVPCNLNIIHKPSQLNPGRTMTIISSISPLMKGQTCPDQINPTKVLSYDNFNWDLFNSLSDYTKDLIKSSVEFQMMQEPSLVRDHETGNDEINDYDGHSDGLPF